MSTKRQGPPKHRNRFAWKPNAGHKINPTEVGGKLRQYSEITGVCQRCKEQIDWKRRYGKYKPLSEPAKCQRCSKRAVRQAYHNLCPGCAKDHLVCAKCCCRVDQIVGRDCAEVEAEQKMLEDAIKNARERDRRTLLRAMNKGESKSSEKPAGNKGNKVGDLFPDSSLDEYAAKTRVNDHNVGGHVRHDVGDDRGEEEEEDDDDDDDDDDGDDNDDNADWSGNSNDNEEAETEDENEENGVDEIRHNHDKEKKSGMRIHSVIRE